MFNLRHVIYHHLKLPQNIWIWPTKEQYHSCCERVNYRRRAFASISKRTNGVWCNFSQLKLRKLLSYIMLWYCVTLYDTILYHTLMVFTYIRVLSLWPDQVYYACAEPNRSRYFYQSFVKKKVKSFSYPQFQFYIYLIQTHFRGLISYSTFDNGKYHTPLDLYMILFHTCCVYIIRILKHWSTPPFSNPISCTGLISRRPRYNTIQCNIYFMIIIIFFNNIGIFFKKIICLQQRITRDGEIVRSVLI